MTVTKETRTLPALAPGPVEMPSTIVSWSENLTRDTTWNEHSHPFHELIWNERGASTAVAGARVWTITPALGLWMPAGILHSGSAIAGTWCRANFFGFDAVRLPRACLAVLAGFSFGLAGVTFQTMLRNPLASPDIIGISSGASAAAAIAIVSLSLDGPQVSALAIVAALAVALLVYGLAFKDGVVAPASSSSASASASPRSLTASSPTSCPGPPNGTCRRRRAG